MSLAGARPTPGLHDAPRLREEVRARGYAIVRLPSGDVKKATTDPWSFAELLFGEAPELVERQPIRPVLGARSFASSDAFTPLHTDSQSVRGIPAHAQVLHCVRPASDGGASLLLDSRLLLARVHAEDPALSRELWTVPRRIPFYFGDVKGPTVSLRGGSLAFTHSPFASDPIASRLRPHIDALAPTEVALAEGHTLVVDNHRMLHGRRAFADARRELMRVLVWTRSRLSDTPAIPAHAMDVDLASPSVPDEVSARRGLVLAFLRGVPAGVLANKANIAESDLYAWRDAFLAGGTDALRK